MIFSMNDKWRDSSILTKIATGVLALCFVLTLICDIIMMSWGLAAGGLIIWYLFVLLVLFLLTLGLYKVNRLARVFVSLIGISIAIGLVFIIWYYVKVIGTANSMTGGFYSLVFSIVNLLIPVQAKAVMVLFILAYVMMPLAWLILIFCGKDFRRKSEN